MILLFNILDSKNIDKEYIALGFLLYMTNGHNLTLFKSNSVNGIEIHSDVLAGGYSLHSRERGKKVGRLNQEIALDNNGGADKCLFCNPENLRGHPQLEYFEKGNVAAFENAAPYFPYDPKVVMLWNDDLEKRKESLHKFKLEDLGREELFFFLKSSIEMGNRFSNSCPSDYNLQRMCFGMNLGRMAGQSIPHFHGQYGWDVVVNPSKPVNKEELALYYRELEDEDLVLCEDDGLGLKVIVPWTPKGQYQIDLHFYKNHETRTLSEEQMKVYSHLTHKIIQNYVGNMNIQNMNIAFSNSPMHKVITPVIAQIIPRTNTPALYEMLTGTNVIDAGLSDVAAEFRKSIDWKSEIDVGKNYNPYETLGDRVVCSTKKILKKSA